MDMGAATSSSHNSICPIGFLSRIYWHFCLINKLQHYFELGLNLGSATTWLQDTLATENLDLEHFIRNHQRNRSSTRSPSQKVVPYHMQSGGIFLRKVQMQKDGKEGKLLFWSMPNLADFPQYRLPHFY